MEVVVDFPGLVRDDRDAILEALHADADIVIVSGGSSVGIEDLAPMLVAQHGELAVHGIAMRPSSPTGLGRIETSPRLLAARQSRVEPVRLRFLRRPRDSRAGRTQQGVAVPRDTRPIESQDQLADRPPRLRAREDRGRSGRAARRGGASVLSSTTRADGFVIVGDDSEGFAAGAEVEVWLYA